MDDMTKKLIEGIGTSTTAGTSDPAPFTYETMIKSINLIKMSPLYYYSGLIPEDDVYKMNPKELNFYSSVCNFDRNTEVVYICGKNARDTLIKEGVQFENYKPEEENSK